jgi:hypothetical protein
MFVFMKNSKSVILWLALLFAGFMASAQDAKPGLYDPSLDGSVELKKMVARASADGKHVLLQVGGNW